MTKDAEITIECSSIIIIKLSAFKILMVLYQ